MCECARAGRQAGRGRGVGDARGWGILLEKRRVIPGRVCIYPESQGKERLGDSGARGRDAADEKWVFIQKLGQGMKRQASLRYYLLEIYLSSSLFNHFVLSLQLSTYISLLGFPLLEIKELTLSFPSPQESEDGMEGDGEHYFLPHQDKSIS